MNSIDPRLLTDADAPLIVFSDHSSGFVEWLIKMRTKGDYNHVMWFYRQGFFASQGNTYSEAPLDRYMKHGNRLKFYRLIGITPVQKYLILASIRKKLSLPWWKKCYDWFGIFGQAIGVKWVNTPWLQYCSEDVPSHLKYMAESGIPEYENAHKVIMGIQKHFSPQELNDYFKQFPEIFQVYGKWEADDER